MNIYKSDNELQIGDNNQYSEQFILSISNNNQINIQMSIDCDEYGDGQFVAKNLTLEQLEELANFCNQKIAQIKNAQQSKMLSLRNPIISLQSNEVQYTDDWQTRYSEFYCAGFGDDVDLFVDLSLNGLQCDYRRTNLTYLFDSFYDKLSYLITYTILTHQQDKFMQLIQTVHSILPFNELYCDNLDGQLIGLWNNGADCFELIKFSDVQSFFKKMAKILSVDEFSRDNIVHQRIELLDDVLNNQSSLKKLLFGDSKNNFIKIE